MSNEYDDEWDAEPRRTPPPGKARAAGIIWMVVGIILIFSGLANCVLSTVLVADRPNADPGPVLNLAWPSLGIGFGLILSGVRIINGKAKDVLGVAVVSILLGFAYFAIGAAIVTGLDDSPVGLILGGACVVVGMTCILPAVLVLAGRSEYLAWRRANPPDDEDEDDDEDDRHDDDRRGPNERPWDRGRR